MAEPLEYSMVEATSREEGVVVDVPLPLVPSADGASSAASSRRRTSTPQVGCNPCHPLVGASASSDGRSKGDDRGDSPFDEARADVTPGDGPSFSRDLLVTDEVRREASASGNTVRTTISLAKSCGGIAANDSNDNSAAMTTAGGGGRKRSDDSNSNGHHLTSPAGQTSEPSYYTRPPRRRSFLGRLSCALRFREYRHTNCVMTPLSFFVLLAITISSLVGLILSFPQFVLGILLGPLLKRNFWLVEFLYRYNIARWGHLKIMQMAGKAKKMEDKAKKAKKLGGHSQTLGQRITVVPDRVYVHPIPQFMDNIAYLIACTPPSEATEVPIIGVLVDCGESKKVLQYMEAIYGRYYSQDYPRKAGKGRGYDGPGIELHAVLCTHRHHDHTAGVGQLMRELIDAGRGGVSVSTGCGGASSSDHGSGQSADVYSLAPGNFLVVGGAIEQVPHCNLFVKNGCYVPLPCASGKGQTNDMNEVVSIEVISVPSHTRGSCVFALRNRAAPDVTIPIALDASNAPLQSHLFTGDAIFTGGGGVPFEADLEYPSDNFIKNPKSLKSKNGSSKFRPGAGVLSMERCFVEVLTRATGVWSEHSPAPVPQAPKSIIKLEPKQQPSQTLLYPGHEYTTDLLMRQFDQKTLSTDIQWNKTPPSTFFEIASHYLVSAHRRGLPPDQKLLTVPTPLEKECVVNPNFRMIRRRGECVVNALKLWYEFGAETLIPDVDDETNIVDESNGVPNTIIRDEPPKSVFTTVYSADLQSVVNDLRRGKLDVFAAADQIESLQGRLDERLIGRRPIPSTLPSHKNVYLGVLALVVLGSGPSAMTVSDANIMNMAPPVDSNDKILINKSRLIAALDGLGLLSKDMSPKLDDIIRLLWQEARLDDGTKHDSTDVESSVNGEDDEIELGLLKLALFGVVLNQRSKFCMPCGGGGSKKPKYDERSWVKKSKLRRTNGELVRHDAEHCLACQSVLLTCPYSSKKAVSV